MDISATQQLVAAPPARDIDVTAAPLSFEAFYERSGRSISRALAATLNDVELAADATNEAMTRAYQRWSTVSKYDNPEAWVYRVGLNWSLSWKQRRRRERDRPVRFGADTVELKTRDNSLDGALAQLSLEHRAVVICRIHLDLSVSQTAEVLKIARGTVKSRLARALDKLRDHVDAEARMNEGAADAG